MAMSVIAPMLVLAAALLMATRGWPTAWILYPGLSLMVVVAIWDLAAPSCNSPAPPREGAVP